MQIPEKIKWVKYKDEILNQTIIAIDGFQLYSLNPIKARIFGVRTEVFRGFPKEMRYFPQIDDEDKEITYILCDPKKGVKTIKEAKKILVEGLIENFGDK